MGIKGVYINLSLSLSSSPTVCLPLQARRKEVFLQERYSHFSMTDPFLALQRDFESGAGLKDCRPVTASPITVLEAVMAHCRKMQERMSAQLAAAESRQKRVGVCVCVYVIILSCILIPVSALYI